MLKVERLVCENAAFHKNCEWKALRVHYGDRQLWTLTTRLKREALKTHTAYRIVHYKFGVITTIKLGHDGRLFVMSNDSAINRIESQSPT